MKIRLLLFILPLTFFSCQDETFDPASSFTKIYDNNSSALDYQPIDVVETESGYLVLASRELSRSDFNGIQVIQLDREGNFASEQTPDDSYVAPVRDFIKIDSSYYFFAMDGRTLSTVIFAMSGDLSRFDINAVSSSPNYTLAASSTSADELLLLSYDPNGLETVISRRATDGSLLQGAGYTIGAGSDVEQQIVNHFVDPERSGIPFFCGETADGQVYFNGFYNYSLSMVFSDFGSEPTGVLQGQGANAGVSKAVSVTGSSFSIFGFQFSDSFIVPQATLDVNSTTASSVDLMSAPTAEFKSRTKSDIVIWTHNGTQYAVVAGETENGQVALYVYDLSTGELKGIEKIGYLNTHNLASIKVDSNNGLLVLGATYVSGRFKRIFLRKMTEAELVSMLK
ncbi:MAG: hypothetical protein JXR03_04680 [Cyclobacteriaceae bacterium]